MIYFSRILALSLCLSACAHQPAAKPVAFGFYAVQCTQVRDVYCVIDETFPLGVCQKYVPQAVEALNVAVGRPILHYAGATGVREGADLWKAGSIIIYSTTGKQWADLFKGFNTLGYTDPKVVIGADSACLTHVSIALSPQITGFVAGLPPLTRVDQVLEHELVHAIGGSHAEASSSFSSIMSPSAQTGASYFTRADIRALRAVYCPELLDAP